MIGEKLRELRTRHNLSQNTLAKKLNVSVRCIKNWEGDIASPSIKSLIMILDYFHISADELLGRVSNDYVSLSCLPDKERRIAKNLLQQYIDEVLRG